MTTYDSADDAELIRALRASKGVSLSNDAKERILRDVLASTEQATQKPDNDQHPPHACESSTGVLSGSAV